MSAFESLVLSPLSVTGVNPDLLLEPLAVVQMLRGGYRGQLKMDIQRPRHVFDQARLAALLVGESSVEDCADLLQSRGHELAISCWGSLGDEADQSPARVLVFSDISRGLYRKLVLRHGRLCGVLALGGLENAVQWQQMLTVGGRVTQRMMGRFQQCGDLQDAAACTSAWGGPFAISGVLGLRA